MIMIPIFLYAYFKTEKVQISLTSFQFTQGKEVYTGEIFSMINTTLYA